MVELLQAFQKSLCKALQKENATGYIERAAKQAALVAVAAWFLIALVLDEIIKSFFFGTIIGLCFFAAKLYYPLLQKKNFAALVERDLPFALLAMSVELNLNVPFEKAMKNIAGENYGAASREFEATCNEISLRGASVQDALLHFSERVDSLQVKRCVSQLVSICDQGGRKNRGLPIKKLAKEMLAKQRAESKEFSGKLVVFSLLFIAVSAIVPALFQSFVTVGSMFLEVKFSALQVLVITTIGFPLLDLAILLYIKNKTPVFLRE